MERHVAIVGAGVIGSAWAARFALHGIDVKVTDPAPDVERIIDEVLANARAALEARSECLQGLLTLKFSCDQSRETGMFVTSS